MVSSAPPSARSAPWLGVALVVGSAIAFSTKAILAKLMYRDGIEPVAVLTLRMGFALPIYAFSVWRSAQAGRSLPRSDLARVVLLGAMLYYGSVIGDFWGLKYISAGLERLILFSYPTLVVLLSAFVLRERLSRLQLLALAVTYVGIAISFRAEAVGANSWLGSGLVFASAISYAGYLVGSTHYIRRYGAERVTSLALAAAAAMTLAHFALQRPRLLGFPPRVYALGLCMALVATVLPTYALAAGIRRIGPGPSAILGTLGPVSTLVLAFLLLDEPIGGVRMVGAAVVLLGATLVAARTPERPLRSPGIPR